MGTGNVRAGGFYFAPIGNLLECPDIGYGTAATIILASSDEFRSLPRDSLTSLQTANYQVAEQNNGNPRRAGSLALHFRLAES
jgi:hypothetical protein